MDRVKEAEEQAAFDRSTHRRFKRALLRGYIEALISYLKGEDLFLDGWTVTQLRHCKHVLKEQMGFRRFRKLYVYAQTRV